MKAKYRTNGSETSHEVETEESVPSWLKYTVYFIVAMSFFFLFLGLL